MLLMTVLNDQHDHGLFRLTNSKANFIWNKKIAFDFISWLQREF